MSLCVTVNDGSMTIAEEEEGRLLRLTSTAGFWASGLHGTRTYKYPRSQSNAMLVNVSESLSCGLKRQVEDRGLIGAGATDREGAVF